MTGHTLILKMKIYDVFYTSKFKKYICFFIFKLHSKIVILFKLSYKFALYCTLGNAAVVSFFPINIDSTNEYEAPFGTKIIITNKIFGHCNKYKTF